MSPTAARTVPASNLSGFGQIGAILAFCATKPTHQGGAYRL